MQTVVQMCYLTMKEMDSGLGDVIFGFSAIDLLLKTVLRIVVPLMVRNRPGHEVILSNLWLGSYSKP